MRLPSMSAASAVVVGWAPGSARRRVGSCTTLRGARRTLPGAEPLEFRRPAARWLPTSASNSSTSSGVRLRRPRGAGRRSAGVAPSDRTGQRRRTRPPQFSSAALASGSSTSRSSPAVDINCAAAFSTVTRKFARTPPRRDTRPGRRRRPAPARRPSAPASASRRGQRARRRTGDRGRRHPGKSAPSLVTVISGCRLKPSRSPSTSSPDAPEQWPSSGPAATAPAAAGDRVVRHAQQHRTRRRLRVAAAVRAGNRHAGAAQGRRIAVPSRRHRPRPNGCGRSTGPVDMRARRHRSTGQAGWSTGIVRVAGPRVTVSVMAPRSRPWRSTLAGSSAVPGVRRLVGRRIPAVPVRSSGSPGGGCR